MKTNRKKKDTIAAIITLVILFLISGCASKVEIRAPHMMFERNPAEKIAILAEGRINWPRMGKGGPVLGLSDSKKALKEHVEKTQQILAKKGYQVVFAQPTGIGYFCDQWWLMPEEYGQEGIEHLQRIEGLEPVFLYSECQQNRDFSKAVDSVIEELEASITAKRLNTFSPSKKDVEIIGKVTEADTICLNRVHGVKYSTRRKVGQEVGQFAIGVLAAAFGSVGPVSGHSKDSVDSLYVFVDATTGDVLWLHITAVRLTFYMAR